MRALIRIYSGMIQDYIETFRKYRGNARYQSRIIDFDNAQRPRSFYFLCTASHEVQKNHQTEKLTEFEEHYFRRRLSALRSDTITSKSATLIKKKKIATRFSRVRRGRFSTFVAFVARVIVVLSEVLYVCIPYSSLFHRIYMLLCSHFRRAIFTFTIRSAEFPPKQN